MDSDALPDTNPFSSFRCWYSSALLLTEFNRPINSWCFLELAVLILLLHKDSKDIGPKIESKKSLSDENFELTLHHYNILKEIITS